MDKERALQLLATSEYGILSMVSDGGGYGIPINFVWDGKESIYIHCAPEGRKLHALEQNPNVSLCVVGRVHLLPRNFTTEYESAIFFGKAHLHLDEEERMQALHLLIRKLSADFSNIGDKYARASFHRTEVIRVDITDFSGKQKHVHNPD